MASLPSNLLVAARSRAVSARRSDGRTLAAVEAEHIRETLQHTGGNRTVAAQMLGVSRVGLLGKMKRYGIRGDSRAPDGRMRSPPIAWTDDLNIGIDDIDAQHQAFHACIGEFLAAMRAGKPNVLSELISYLDAYLAQHCATEERFMAQYSFPGMAGHCAQHQELIATCKRYRAALQAHPDSPSLIVDVANWLTAWMRKHLRGPDRELGLFLHAS